MCLYPQFIKNRKYTNTKKNGGNVPTAPDERVLLVPVPCGKCLECMRKKAREWKIRLMEEIKVSNKAVFVTLTFTNENLNELTKEIGVEECNAVATIAVRRFLERWRKLYKKSVRHWLITELGHPPHSERIHLHGLLWTEESDEQIGKIWKYGNAFCGRDISNKTISYIIKYVTKIDKDHKNYYPTILTSPKIGDNYLHKLSAKLNRFQGKETKDYYRSSTGHLMALPDYYKKRIYSDEERELLWLQKMDEEYKYINGIKIKVSNEHELKIFDKILIEKQEENIKMGYGSNSNEWKKKFYNVRKSDIDREKRIKGYQQKDIYLKKLAKKFGSNNNSSLPL